LTRRRRTACIVGSRQTEWRTRHATARRNFASAERPDALRRGSALAWAASIARGKAMIVVSARDAESLVALVRPLPHYGRRYGS